MFRLGAIFAYLSETKSENLSKRTIPLIQYMMTSTDCFLMRWISWCLL